MNLFFESGFSIPSFYQKNKSNVDGILLDVPGTVAIQTPNQQN